MNPTQLALNVLTVMTVSISALLTGQETSGSRVLGRDGIGRPAVAEKPIGLRFSGPPVPEILEEREVIGKGACSHFITSELHRTNRHGHRQR